MSQQQPVRQVPDLACTTHTEGPTQVPGRVVLALADVAQPDTIRVQYRLAHNVFVPCYFLGSKLVTQRSKLCTLDNEGFYSS